MESNAQIKAVIDKERQMSFRSNRLCIFRSGVSIEEAFANFYTFGSTDPVLFDSEALVVYGDNSNIVAEIRDFEYIEQMMGERYLQADINSPVVIDWKVGDWVLFRGEIFSIKTLPSIKKVSRSGRYGGAFNYANVKLDSIIGDLATKQFLDYVPGDNKMHYTGLETFSFYVSSLWDFAHRIQANLDRVYPGEWIVECKPGGESFKDKSISISSNTSIFNALALVNSQLYQNFEIREREEGCVVHLEGKTQVLDKRTRVITLGGATPVMSESLSYGKGNGLISLQKTPKNSTPTITRLHAYGSKKNMPTRYYNRKYKMRKADGTPMYPMFWDGDKYLLETTYIPSLMIPKEYWQKGDSDINDVFLDSTTDNFHKAGFNQEGKLHYVDGVLQNPQDVVEGSKIFDTESKDYDECYPTLREMTIEPEWADIGSVFCYLSGYRNYPITAYTIVRDIVTSVIYIRIEMSFAKNDLGYSSFEDFINDSTIKDIYQQVMSKFEKRHEEFKNTKVSETFNKLTPPSDKNHSWKIPWTSFNPTPDYFFNSTAITKSRDGVETVLEIRYFHNFNRHVAEDKINEIFAGAGAYAEKKGDDLVFQESVQYTRLLVKTDILNIKKHTYNQEGRLDKVLSESIGNITVSGEEQPIRDNGVSEEGGGFGTDDTKGVEIIDGFYLYIPQLLFDISDWQYDNEAKLVMRTGLCAGREFVIADCVLRNPDDYSAGWKITLGRTIDGDTNRIYPNNEFVIRPGDEFVLTGVNLPHVYVEAAEKKLFKNAMKYLMNADTKLFTYTPQIDSKWMMEHPEYDRALRTGVKFRFTDEDIDGNKEMLITLKQLNIKYGKSVLPSYDIVLDDETENISVAQMVASSIKNSDVDTSGIILDTKDKLSKVTPDIAEGHISFNNGISVNGPVNIKSKRGYTGTQTIPLETYVKLSLSFDEGVLTNVEKIDDSPDNPVINETTA